ncbi:MarR family winged helix-turn-helix transcriptional regulator [Streptomyces sp. NBC_01727]|uniref:MarR family winged helix-turn-helix transcriptional regulator n=1 Tax=Streptomyces sp. NBC_01727 TaxID=2975924 RepID=UPI002E0D21A3|nr:MarR family transcriptional regulator [Streptomyces sp. NBC_01727]
MATDPTPDPATRWLTAREQEIWRSYMATAIELQARLDRQLRSDAGMPVAYYEILVVLSESPGCSLRMSRLAEVCNSSRSRLSHAMTAMEKSGWVSRCAVDGDRRGAVAQLTDAGLEALREAAPGHVTEVRECLFDSLTEQQAEVLHEISQAIGVTLRQRG